MQTPKENLDSNSTTVPSNADVPSGVDYDEYLKSVRVSVGTDEVIKTPAKTSQPNAENEVVAILLSAMMSNIVKEFSKLGKSSSCLLTSKRSKEYLVNSQDSFSPRQSNVEDAIIFERESQTSYCSALLPESVTERHGETDYSLNSCENLEVDARDSQNQSCNEGDSKSTQLRRLRDLLINEASVFSRAFLDSDQVVYTITFKQGNVYQGYLLNCRMHGKGKFIWPDGSVYEGDFCLGKMTGQGKLHWPDGSWYEGEFREGFRHGRGLYVQPSAFYAGYWRCGRRHGAGAMFYNHLDTSRNYYNGEWCADKKQGTGLRSYPSGVMYSGHWKSGERHGLGTMVWTNGDVYSGHFHRGDMHGYGEYTWNRFVNKQLVLPEENCYYGDWVKNIRHGNGTLETSSGVVVKGTWNRGKKHGPAEVICSNGQSLYADNLFDEDNLRLPEHSFEADSLMDASFQSLPTLPVNAANHEINLGFYAKRLIDYIQECSLGKPFCVSNLYTHVEIDTKRTFSPNRSHQSEHVKIDLKEEESYIRTVITRYLSSLTSIYTTYAQMCCQVQPNFPTVLLRIMWWQLLRDCKIHSKGNSLAYFDVCIANNKASLVKEVHYPFERLMFWQFLHCLMEVSWELYTKKCIGTPTVKGIIASGLHKLITDDLLPNAGRHSGNALFGCRDLLNLDSLYKYYRSLGEPYSAREFLKNVAKSEENGMNEEKVPKYFEYEVRGENAIRLGGKLSYLPRREPLLDDARYQFDHDHPRNLSCFNSLGIPAVFECILKICPSITSGELIVNIDYNIVFLEFYEILILCARQVAKEKCNKIQSPTEVEEPVKKSSKESSLQMTEVLAPPEKKTQRKKSSVGKKSKKKK